MSTSYPPHYAYPSAPPLKRVLPTPPRLHWGWVFALSVLTLGVFSSVWLLVQANWIRRMRDGKSAGFWVAIANVAWLPLMFAFGVAIGIAGLYTQPNGVQSSIAMLDPITRIVSVGLYLATAFTMRREMQEQPIDLVLGGGMTFLFATIYFQYQLRDYGKRYVADGGLGLAGSTHSGVAMPGTVDMYPAQAMAYPPLPSAEGTSPLGPGIPPRE